MLKKILTPSDCADCQWCCQFDESDIWEMPFLTDKDTLRITEMCDRACFNPRGEGFGFKAEINPETGLAACPALTENGCALGEEKPFDCRIWPFRVMKIADRNAITLSTGCPEISGMSVSDIMYFLDGGFAEKVFAYARENPDAVHDYHDGYVVLLFDK